MMAIDKTSTDTLTPAERSARMALVRNKDTKPELLVRRLVHGLGYRYRLHVPDLPGRPDLVFRPRRKVIFVHGCFWHRHDDPECKLARLPRSRADFWLPKLEGNRARDARVVKELEDKGWKVLTIWECQTKARASLEARIREFLEA
jgi:DNA mismatch endonuclease (patch repair protein)